MSIPSKPTWYIYKIVGLQLYNIILLIIQENALSKRIGKKNNDLFFFKKKNKTEFYIHEFSSAQEITG